MQGLRQQGSLCWRRRLAAAGCMGHGWLAAGAAAAQLHRLIENLLDFYCTVSPTTHVCSGIVFQMASLFDGIGAAGVDEGHAVVLTAGGAQALVEAMQAHPHVVGVQDKCCGAMRNLAGSAEGRVRVLRAGGARGVVRATYTQPAQGVC
eukprot:SAG25_NODE_154_length_13563_cov_44.588978_23_plen_149_part_00